MQRNLLITKLQSNLASGWDIIVIGGGATGLGVAVDAANRGYRTLLLEQADFAQATSSRSTKLMHGGVRYLAQGSLLLVMQALKERSLMHKNASNITYNQEFVIPVYTWYDAIKYYLGLKFYDILAGPLSMGKSHFIGKVKTLKRLPLLQTKDLKGGIVYHDGQFDDARFAICLAHKCIENDGLAINYFKVNNIIKNPEGHITGVKATDLVSGTGYELLAKAVINATGVFADSILRMDSDSAIKTIRPSQGVHIVLDSSFLQSNTALMIPKTSDGRVLFAIPWYGKVVVGTTDTPIDSIEVEPRAMKKEIDFILETAGRFMSRQPQTSDILSVFAGLRPLAANPDSKKSTREISRNYKITVSSSGLISILGGKWTIYRKMAEDTINKTIELAGLEPKPCKTKNLKLSKTPENINMKRLKIYGEHAYEIEQFMKDHPTWAKLLHTSFEYTKAEVVWICRNELPVKLEDMLARRLRTLLLDAGASAEIAPAIVKIMAKEFGHNKNWEYEQLLAYKHLLRYYISKEKALS